MVLPSSLKAWIIAVAVALPAGLLVGDWLDLKILDRQFHLLRKFQGPIPVNDDPVLVGIDEKTYTQYEWPFGLWHPYFGRFLMAMADANARAIVLDVVMPQKPLPEALTRAADQGFYDYHDDLLLQSILELSKKNIPLIIAEAPDESGSRIIRGYSDMISLISSISSEDDYFGMAQVARDRDGVYRRYQLDTGGRPTLAATTASRLGYHLPKERQGIINYLLGSTVDYVPLHSVTAWHKTGDAQSLVNRFQGKTVMLGSVTSTQDRKPLPIRLFNPSVDQSNLYQPGVILHLQALRTYLSEKVILPVGPMVSVALVILVLFGWWFSSTIMTSIIVTLLGSFGLVTLSTIYLLNDLMLGVGAMLIILGLMVFGRLSYESFKAFKDRQQLKTTFAGYVSPAVLSSILKGDISSGHGGEIRRVCILFSDIRQFTTRSENQSPEAVISLLNRYFEQMVECVHLYHGTVDKFIGDGLMAFFGAPNKLENPAIHSFNAACKMLVCLDQLNQELLEEGIEPLKVGIGLHIGEVVVGHVGSSGRHEYTAIGDTVNAAARLEDLTREIGYPILLSEEFHNELEHNPQFIDLGQRSLKGRSSMKVFGVNPCQSID